MYERVAQLAHMPADASIWQVVQAVGNGSSVTAQDTAHFALWCAAQHLDHYPAALWLTTTWTHTEIRAFLATMKGHRLEELFY